jgi:hypothetical protein
MEKDNLKARNQEAPDFSASEAGKAGTKLNILGMEITPDDSALRGVTNRTGISGKTMLEQMSHQPGIPVIGSGEVITAAAGEVVYNPADAPQGQAGEGYQAGSEDPGQPSPTQVADRSSWIDPLEDPALGRQAEATEYKGSVEE